MAKNLDKQNQTVVCNTKSIQTDYITFQVQINNPSEDF
jgi:hypothetical protein